MLCKFIGHDYHLYRVEYFVDSSYGLNEPSSRVFVTCDRCGKTQASKKSFLGVRLPLDAYVRNYKGWSKHVAEKDRRIKGVGSP